MTSEVLHVLESLKPRPGNVCVSLVGLMADAARRGLLMHGVGGDGGTEADSPMPVDCVVPSSPDLRLRDYDLVHIHGFDYPLARTLAQAANSAGVPYVISPHGALGAQNRGWTFRERLNWLFRGRRLVRGAAFLAACNPAERALLTASAIHRDVRLLPYGLHFAQYHTLDPKPTQADGGRMLVMGPMGPQSGCVAVLKAVAELGSAADGWTVLLAGDASEAWKKAIETGVRRKGAADRVQWREASSLKSQKELLAEADVLVSACEYPCLPVGTLQALAVGLPVACTSATVLPEMNGHVVECGSGRAGLREGLRLLLQMSPADRRARAAKARSFAERTLDWSVLADRWVCEYQSLV